MPAKRFGSQLDLARIPVLGLVPESAPTASPPASPVNGQFWFDTTVGRLMIREANAWVIATRTGAELTANKGVANGYASLDATTKVPIAQIPTGTTGSTVPFGNDTRFSDSRPPNGTAGGSLTGSYPNPTIANLAIVDAMVAAANKDGLAATPSMRTLGTGAQQALAGNTRLDTLAAPTAAVSLNNQKITSLATPTADNDAANKVYVDSARQGLRLKDAVRVATVGNIALTGTQTIDGAALIAGDRVLVKNQTNAAENGIYVVAAGAWTRGGGTDTTGEVQDGATTFVQQGTTQPDTTWTQVNTIVTIGTTAQNWVQQGAAANYTAGAGLTLNVNDFNVGGTTNRITVSADAVDIASNYAGQTSITTVGTLTAGALGAGFTTVALAQGGTGATTAVGARTALGTVGKYSADLGALTSGSESVITHNLGSGDVHAQFRTSTGYEEGLSWRVIDANSIGVTADTPYSAAALRVVVIG